MPKKFMDYRVEREYDKAHKSEYDSHLSAIRKIASNGREFGRVHDKTLYFMGDSVLSLYYDNNLPSGNSGSAAISQAMNNFKAWIIIRVTSKKDDKPTYIGDLEGILGVSSEVEN